MTWVRTARVILGSVLAVGGLVVPVGAQAPASDAERVKTRQRISMMEGVLERAVSNGAENLLRQVRTIIPDPPMLSGVPQVRGFVLEGYGVFFDVEVPALRLPVTWPMRWMIEDNRATLSAAVAEVRALVAQQLPRQREQLEAILQRLEGRAAIPEVRTRNANPVVTEPDEAYTKAVREALVDAMIENSGAVQLGNDEFLIVAARDNVPRDPLMPGDTAGLNTLTFRIKGSDLGAFRSGRLSLEEARTRVEVKEN